MKKKFFAMLIALMMVGALVACGDKEEAPKEEAAPQEEASTEVNGELEMDCFDSDVKTKVSYTIPAEGWSTNEASSWLYLYNVPKGEDDSGSPRIQVEMEPTMKMIDSYKKDFENCKDIDSRTIGGIEMTGRTYNYVGMDWTEYYGVLPSGIYASVKISKVDISDGTEGAQVLDSLKFE